MGSRQDVLKIAQADMQTIGRHLAAARQPITLFTRPLDEVESAIGLLERTARRIRKAYGFDERDK